MINIQINDTDKSDKDIERMEIREYLSRPASSRTRFGTL